MLQRYSLKILVVLLISSFGHHAIGNCSMQLGCLVIFALQPTKELSVRHRRESPESYEYK